MTDRWFAITTGALVAVEASDTTPSARLINEMRTRQRAVADIEFLSDVIGPRLTTSPAIIRAHT